MITQKPLSELPGDLDFATTKNWAYGKWGYADYRIEHFQSDGSADIFQLPPTVGRLIEQERKHAADEARAEIRKAIGV